MRTFLGGADRADPVFWPAPAAGEPGGTAGTSRRRPVVHPQPLATCRQFRSGGRNVRHTMSGHWRTVVLRSSYGGALPASRCRFRASARRRQCDRHPQLHIRNRGPSSPVAKNGDNRVRNPAVVRSESCDDFLKTDARRQDPIDAGTTWRLAGDEDR